MMHSDEKCGAVLAKVAALEAENEALNLTLSETLIRGGEKVAALEAEVERLRTQMDQCVWMLHTAAQEYMTGSRAVISWTDYIRDLESRWATREEAGDDPRA